MRTLYIPCILDDQSTFTLVFGRVMVDFLLCLALSRAALTSHTRFIDDIPNLKIGIPSVRIRCLWLLTFCLTILDLKG